MKTDPRVFPVLMGDDLARKCPMTLCTGREFDLYKRDTTEYADLMRKHGKLLAEPYFQPGTTHMSYMMEDNMTGGPELRAAFKNLFDHFL